MRTMTAALAVMLSPGAADTVFADAGRTAAPATQIGTRATAGSAAPQRATPRRSPRGFATFYAQMLDGRRTASGTTFDNDDMVAAHPTYPFGTLVRVTNLRNGRTVDVRIVDRGPARSARASGVIIDLSRAAAGELGFLEAGRTRVRLDVLQLGEDEDEPASADSATSAAVRRTAAAADR